MVLSRVWVTTAISLLTVGEVAAVAVLGFGTVPRVPHPVVFAVGLLATAVATAGTATLMAALFVATRTARTFQNSLSYPVLLLGGVFAPSTGCRSGLTPSAASSISPGAPTCCATHSPRPRSPPSRGAPAPSSVSAS